MEASLYLGIALKLFRQMVEAELMPRPRVVTLIKDSPVRTWDVEELDHCYKSLPREGEVTPNTWEDYRNGEHPSKKC